MTRATAGDITGVRLPTEASGDGGADHEVYVREKEIVRSES
jgi:hypothetical protein